MAHKSFFDLASLLLVLTFEYMLNLVSFLGETGILIENMRREGFELSVSPPKVM